MMRRGLLLSRHKCKALRGFTLVELIVVMIVISILAAVSIASITSKSAYSVNTQADQMRRDLNHLQFLASSWGVALQMNMTGSSGSYTGYTVTCPVAVTGTKCTSAGLQPTDPATGQAFGVTFTDGVTITSTSPSTCSTIAFDSLGRPTSGTSYLTTNPVCTYTLSGNGRSISVYVRPLGGLAQTS